MSPSSLLPQPQHEITWVKHRLTPKWNPGKLNQGLKPAVPWWFNFDPYPPWLLTGNPSSQAPKRWRMHTFHWLVCTRAFTSLVLGVFCWIKVVAASLWMPAISKEPGHVALSLLETAISAQAAIYKSPIGRSQSATCKGEQQGAEEPLLFTSLTTFPNLVQLDDFRQRGQPTQPTI